MTNRSINYLAKYLNTGTDVCVTILQPDQTNVPKKHKSSELCYRNASTTVTVEIVHKHLKATGKCIIPAYDYQFSTDSGHK